MNGNNQRAIPWAGPARSLPRPGRGRGRIDAVALTAAALFACGPGGNLSGSKRGPSAELTAFFQGGPIDVTTHHYRNDRTGANLNETVDGEGFPA